MFWKWLDAEHVGGDRLAYGMAAEVGDGQISIKENMLTGTGLVPGP